MYFEIPFSALARDIDMLLGEGRKVTHSKLFRLLSKKGSTPKGKNLFQEGFCVKESKKGSHKSCLPCKQCVRAYVKFLTRIFL